MSNMWLHIFDSLLFFLHLGIVILNLFGWVFRRTRVIQVISLCLTAISWFGLGAFYGIGYCPLTDWQWSLKRTLGETALPASYVKYYMDKWFGVEFAASSVDTAVMIIFVLAVLCTAWVHIRTYMKEK